MKTAGNNKRRLGGGRGSGGDSGGGKSYYKQKQSNSSSTNNPKRGPAGMLLTCESGREHKAGREGLAILQQDWEHHYDSTKARDVSTSLTSSPSTSSTPSASHRDSLDTELEQLRQQQRTTPPPFAVYETGCKGTVFIICTASRLIVPLRPKFTDEGIDPAPTKKIKLDEEAIDGATIKHGDNVVANSQSATTAEVSSTTKSSNNDVPLVDWNPFDVMQRVVQDMESGDNTLTSSRFITRMIPIQASCYSSIEDIQHAVHKLLEPIVAAASTEPKSNDNHDTSSSRPSDQAKVTTFAIQEKRRFCGHLTHDKIVDAIGGLVEKISNGWKVNLTRPDYTIWIDVAKNIAGVSVVPALRLKPKNFNLAELRDSLAAVTAASAASTEATAATEPVDSHA